MHTDEQEKMHEDYSKSLASFLQLQVPYKMRLKKAAEEGLLLFAKYGLLLFLVWLSLNFVNGLIAGSQNGTQSAIYINQLIEKGYLPKAVNGQVPPKEVENEKTSSAAVNPTPKSSK